MRNMHFNKEVSIGNILAFACVAMALMMFLSSCAGKDEVGISKDTIYDRPMPKIEHQYQLGPGDVLDIVYHYTPKPDTKAYVLSVADVLKVEFAYHPDMNRELTVRPDGNITMPRKGPVMALGLTTEELDKKISEIYSKEFIDPVVTVTMIQYNRTIDRLKTAITTSTRGQSKLTTIRPDGYASFPVISDVLAGGKTLPELKKVLSEKYQEQVDNLTVTLILKVMNANTAYIMGEVLKPDRYLMQKNFTVSQLVARAGGTTEEAEKSTVLVISRDKDRRPWARLVNLEKMIYDGDISQDIMLQQYDIVYVPKDRISRRNRWVEKYINRMIPSNLLGPYELGGTGINGALIDIQNPVIRK